jgi:hypothetical protein
VKARNHSWVASALPHSEGIAYKPLCGEIAMRLRVGRMRPISDDGLGQYNPDLSEGLWGGRVITHNGSALSSPRPDTRAGLP